MKSTNFIQQRSLNLPPLTWHRFRSALLSARQENEEVIGFFFCKRHQLSHNKIRYIPQAWVVPTPDCYEQQSTSGLVLKQSFHWYLLKTHFSSQCDIVHVHTHAGTEPPFFSAVDDRHESA
ncbi:MAG: hypothetical protein ACFB4I_23320 [Cyanophyceae cyanobacterium]